MNTRRISRGGLAVIYVLLSLGLLVAIYPFWYMLSNSVKTGMEIMAYPNALPRQINLGGYLDIFKQFNMARLFGNSLYLAALSTVLSCLFNAMMGYAVEKMHFKGRDVLFRIVLSTMMIPSILLLVPTYMFLFRIHWVNTYRALIFPTLMSGYNIFLFKSYFKHIDNEYIEAAQCDGAHHLTVFLRIVLPMSVPVVTTVGLLTFLYVWNDLFYPLLYLRDQAKYTLQLGLYLVKGSVPGYHLEQLWAALGISTLPMLVVYLIFQRQFVRSYAGVSLR